MATSERYIALIRYGSIPTPEKIRNAEKYHLKGVLLYTDPAEVDKQQTSDSSDYPNSWWLSDNKVRIQSVLRGEGDPLTPGWASVEDAYRIESDSEDVNNRFFEPYPGRIPRIPVLPVSGQTAKAIFQSIANSVTSDVLPNDWIGGFNSVLYKLGGAFDGARGVTGVKMVVHQNVNVKKIKNLIGIIKGSVEPGNYYIKSNWKYISNMAINLRTNYLSILNEFKNQTKPNKA